MSKSRAYQLGYDAYLDRTQCGFEHGTQEFEDWWEGNAAAQADCAW